MYVKDFPNCCTAKVLIGFGGTITSGINADNTYDTKAIVKEVIQKFNSDHFSGMAMVVATLNNHQIQAIEALKILKFKHSKWMSKEQHPDTKIRLYYIHVDDLEKVIAEVKSNYIKGI